MGRPPIGRMVNVRIPAGDLASLDAIAKAKGVKRAELVREALRLYLTGHT
jgi:metal-responsive CopG/Arc/MetJ family transcriptional regulator